MDEKIGDLKSRALSRLHPGRAWAYDLQLSMIADARKFFEERSADLGAVGYHAEFPYWVPAKKSR